MELQMPKTNGLTDKQKKFVAAKASGKSGIQAILEAYDTTNIKTASVMAVENLAKPSIKEALAPLLKKHDLTLDNALKQINLAMNANKVVQVEGDFYETEVPDIPTRLQGSDRVLKLLGVNQESSSNMTFINVAGDIKNELSL